MVDLKLFSGPSDGLRYDLTPFSRGDFTFATDGHVLVRIPRVAEVQERVTAPKIPEQWFDQSEVKEWLPIPELPSPSEPADCPTCHGGDEPPHDCPECACKCDDCDGTGKEIPKPVGVIVGTRKLSETILTRMKTLPGPVFLQSDGDKHSQCKFKFEGGLGCLMPMVSK